jgi:hypothetical protein
VVHNFRVLSAIVQPGVFLKKMPFQADGTWNNNFKTAIAH